MILFLAFMILPCLFRCYLWLPAFFKTMDGLSRPLSLHSAGHFNFYFKYVMQ